MRPLVLQNDLGCPGKAVARGGGKGAATSSVSSPPSYTPLALAEQWSGPEPGPQTPGPGSPQALSAAPRLPA